MNTTQSAADQITLFDEIGRPALFVSVSDFLDDETAADLARYGMVL